MAGITTHVLDTARGRPAGGVAITLAHFVDGKFAPVGHGVTDSDGRLRTLTTETVAAGVYRLDFATGDYFAARGEATFFPSVSITFEVTQPEQHHHVPLLLCPFGYSTYRGS